jgi:hypothetical protein
VTGVPTSKRRNAREVIHIQVTTCTWPAVGPRRIPSNLYARFSSRPAGQAQGTSALGRAFRIRLTVPRTTLDLIRK